MNFKNINLIKNKTKIWTFSTLLILISLSGILFSSFYPPVKMPINLGLDFVGGNEIRIERLCSSQCSDLTSDEIINKLKLRFEDKKLLNNIRIQVQNDNKLISVRTPFINLEKSEELVSYIDQLIGPLDFTTKDIRNIGPKIGIRTTST